MTSNSLPKPSQHNLSRRLIVRFLNKLYKKLPSKELPKAIDSIIIFAKKLGDAILLCLQKKLVKHSQALRLIYAIFDYNEKFLKNSF